MWKLCQVLTRNSQLKSLDLSYNNLSSLEPELLASVVTNLTSEQDKALKIVSKAWDIEYSRFHTFY